MVFRGGTLIMPHCPRSRDSHYWTGFWYVLSIVWVLVPFVASAEQFTGKVVGIS